MEYSLIIILLPLLSFLVIGLCGHKMTPRTAGLLGTTGLAVITVLAYTVAWNYFSMPRVDGVFESFRPFNIEWLRFTDKLHIDLGLLIDPLSVMMLVVVTTVSLMVHIYSMGYMHGEKGFQRYYAFLSLFTFSMLGLVVATNIFQMYIFWELVGASSYLLIGFYYTKDTAIAASKKAFIVTRFADLGFLIGILVLSFYTETFDFGQISGESFLTSTGGKTFLGLSVTAWALALIFMGGAGKSAMFPLHIWLPDAMEGPTPVSALIHAATMVVAGVYLVARLFPVYVVSAPEVLDMIAYVGAFTALFSALIACVQTDIKRVLAFSTISQIGYMMVALGVARMGDHEGLGYMASMFHLFTHAMFKALLFLGAGAIIHAVHSNEMIHMGALRKHMPITHLTFLIACLAIAGIPPFSGFFSKDEILTAVFHYDKLLFFWMFAVAGLTAFYMFRLYYRIFWGTDTKYEHTPHEAPKTMSLPLIFLALVTCVAGFIPFGHFVSSNGLPYTIHLDMSIALMSIAVAVIGIGLATWLYKKDNDKPQRMADSFKGYYRAAYRRFYIDEVYMFVTKKIIFNCISKPIAWFDRHVVDGTMDMLASVTQNVSYGIRKLQSGQIQFYTWIFVMGVLVISLLVLIF